MVEWSSWPVYIVKRGPKRTEEPGHPEHVPCSVPGRRVGFLGVTVDFFSIRRPWKVLFCLRHFVTGSLSLAALMNIPQELNGLTQYVYFLLTLISVQCRSVGELGALLQRLTGWQRLCLLWLTAPKGHPGRWLRLSMGEHLGLIRAKPRNKDCPFHAHAIGQNPVMCPCHTAGERKLSSGVPREREKSRYWETLALCAPESLHLLVRPPGAHSIITPSSSPSFSSKHPQTPPWHACLQELPTPHPRISVPLGSILCST